jgi:hypothetical protein
MEVGFEAAVRIGLSHPFGNGERILLVGSPSSYNSCQPDAARRYLERDDVIKGISRYTYFYFSLPDRQSLLNLET